ncbi:uncharacterized protein [Amphiura filiformis]|uniref:uncharacterized protein n=1 Tax=Amphiura filiformis TaxID=82378 RepID=UPI003B21FD41
MATAVIAALLLILCSSLSSLMDAAQTRVSISTPTSPVSVGGILAIQCQVWDIQPHFTIRIFRVSNGRTEQLTNGGIILSSDKSNMFLATRTFPDRSSVYFLTMTDIIEDDQGEYICRVIDVTESSRINEDSLNVELYSLPSNQYPICNSIPNQPIALNIGDRMTLKCTSEKGIPTVQMKWRNTNSAGYLSSYETMDGNLIRSEVITEVDQSFNGAVFQCEITSDGFPDWKRICIIGPITVRSHHINVNEKPRTEFENKKNQEPIDKLSLRESCGQCPSSNDMLESYLTVATVGTGLLTIIFLITTIIMCRKYHNISEQTLRQPARVLTSQQSVEPVYVSLQRRPQSTYSEREYMTLEDPNNPEKIK